MSASLDCLPIFFITSLFALLIAFFYFKKKKGVEKQIEYQRLRNDFFHHLPAKDILVPEDYRIMKALISSSELEGVHLLLSKNIIKELAQTNEEVQFQLRTFFEKVLPIIKNIDEEDGVQNPIITECQKLFNLYANKETREHFKNTPILFAKH